MKPLGNIKLVWSDGFAYAIGLLATDGCLSKDGRHIDFTSKNRDQVETFKDCLGLKNKIGKKARGGSQIKKYFRVQFGDVIFYNFLLKIGLSPAKSKILGPLKIKKEYFKDFLRGCVDGDGNINIAKHPESQYPQLRLRLCSASTKFLLWMKNEIKSNAGITGGWIDPYYPRSGVGTLAYGKVDSIKLLEYIYYDGVQYYLVRKYNIAKKFWASGEIGTRVRLRTVFRKD